MKKTAALGFLLLVLVQCSYAGDDTKVLLDKSFNELDAGHPEKAVRIWQELAIEHNDASAKVNLGNAYRAGNGVKQSYAEAFKWYNKAKEQGHPLAYAALGVMYDQGLGVEKSPQKAAEYWSVAATKGDAQSQYNLGIVLYNGIGVPQDKPRGRDLLQTSAAQGYPPAVELLKNITKWP